MHRHRTHPGAAPTSLPTLFFWVVPDALLRMPCFMQMKTWMMIFLHKICNFIYFTCEKMGADVSTWNRKLAFHVWNSTCIIFLIICGILSVSQRYTCAHVFLHEWGILYILDMKSWAYTSLLEFWNRIHFLYENLNEILLTWSV